MNPCPVCGLSGSAESVGEANGYTLRLCSGCDLTYADPMRGPGAKWYEEHSDYLKVLLLDLDVLNWNHRQFLRDLPRRGGRLLDVGCGSGRFLAQARSLGYTVTGCDFNPVAVEMARKRYSLPDVHLASLEEFRRRHPERRFDVVTAFEVMEHVDDPREFLAHIVDVLDTDGMVAVSVPFRDRWPRFGTDSPWDLPPHHLTRWSKRAISEAFRRAGLDIVTLRTGWMIGEELWTQYVRFGMVDRLFRHAAADGSDPHRASKLAPLASKLLRVKRAAATVAGAPINAVLGILGATGMDMYVLARRQ